MLTPSSSLAGKILLPWPARTVSAAAKEHLLKKNNHKVSHTWLGSGVGIHHEGTNKKHSGESSLHHSLKGE